MESASRYCRGEGRVVPRAVSVESDVHRITMGSDFLPAFLFSLPVTILQLSHIHMWQRLTVAAVRTLRSCQFESLDMMFILLFSVLILRSYSAAADLIPLKYEAVLVRNQLPMFAEGCCLSC